MGRLASVDGLNTGRRETVDILSNGIVLRATLIFYVELPVIFTRFDRGMQLVSEEVCSLISNDSVVQLHDRLR